MTYTPGPWVVPKRKATVAGYNYTKIETRGKTLIAFLPAGATDDAANARLIAKAPELKAELETLMDEFAAMLKSEFQTSSDDDRWWHHPVLIHARALLASIDGGDQ